MYRFKSLSKFLSRGQSPSRIEEQTSSRIFLVDPDLGKIGHHRRYSTALKDAFEGLGFHVRLLAGFRCPKSYANRIGATRAFKSSIYFDVENGFSTPVRWIISNAQLAKELMGALPEVSADDLIVVHTTARDQLLGYYAWYIGLPEPRPRICIQIMFPPTFRVPATERGLAIELMGRGLSPWIERDDDRVLIAVDNTRLSEHLDQLFCSRFPLLPMPIWAGPAPSPSRPRTNVPLLFLPGRLRREKGKHILKSAVPALKNNDFSLMIQSNRRHRWHRESAPHLKVAPLQDYRAYLQMIMDADAVLLPYDPEEYAYRSSNVFVDALGCGKPVLVPAGTAMAEELEQLGRVGVVMKDYSPQGFAASVRELVQNLEELSSAAVRVAPAFRAKHSAAAFAEEVVRWASAVRPVKTSKLPEAVSPK